MILRMIVFQPDFRHATQSQKWNIYTKNCSPSSALGHLFTGRAKRVLSLEN
jgi:hypothetical protein